MFKQENSNMRYFKQLLIAVLICTLILSGCSKDKKSDDTSNKVEETVMPSENGSVQESQAPTAASGVTSTPAATASSTPGATVSPTPSATATVLPTSSAKVTATATPKPTVKATTKPSTTKKPATTTTKKPSTTSSASATSKPVYKTASLESNVQNGAILHAFNWSYNTIKSNLASIKEAGYSAVQTSPAQQPKDYSSSYRDVSGQWWKLYQPVSFSIAKSSWLGTSSELKALCKAADSYGIKIIVDVVANHMGSSSDSNTTLSAQVKTYEPTLYNNYNTYFHSYTSCSDGSTKNVVWGNIGMPDLNTSNSYVQERVISLLKECIDCGVDGFRFDAAKHIETSSDGSYASNFWSNILSSAKSYASNKGVTLYVYGEILNTPGSGRSFSYYTSNMSITDNKTGDNVLAKVNSKDASGASSSHFYSGQSASKLVLWAESHDTYMGSSGSMGLSSTKSVSQTTVDKAYAIVASRNSVAALYFVRPGSASMGAAGTGNYKSTAISKVNLFRNYFTGKSEYLSSSNSVVMNERYSSSRGSGGGAVLVNVNGTSKTISNMTTYRLGNGTYYDQITGNKFTVTNGKISGKIGSTGIAVVM